MQPSVEIATTDAHRLRVRFAGTWRIGVSPLNDDTLLRRLGAGDAMEGVVLEADSLEGWDSSLLVYLRRLIDFCHDKEIPVDDNSLPPGVRRLLKLADTVPERQGARRETAPVSLLSRIGEATQRALRGAAEMLDFLGAATLAFGRLLTGRARFRRRDLALIIQETGPGALPIVTLISLLVGVILAFVGAVQLEMFGAQIFIANLVGLGMAREMGAMMTAIIVAGRTGAAFAAQLGTMQVNEEIDAFKTLGVSPMEFLVLPRMLALMLMVPLLCLYADLLGIVGGMLIGVGLMDITFLEYFHQTRDAVGLTDFATGLIKGTVFGALVALAGCLRGMQCGRSSSAVGEAATSAVVTSLVLIIVSDAVLTVIYDQLGV